jgi:hypothetical protein
MAIEIRYALNQTAAVSARLFDCKGKLVVSRTDGPQTAGYKIMKVDLKRRELSSGEYVLRISAGGSRISKTVIISR